MEIDMKVQLIYLLLLLTIPAFTQNYDMDKKYLLVRADDIGSSHSADVACIKSYQEGIVRSVELMVPCAWFPEAVKMLNENPGLDVGVHLVLTSEWESVKWRPLTPATSLVDAAGFFFPMVWQREDFPPNTSIQSAKWKIEEIEKELRAQIELAMARVPHVSHLSTHMEFARLDPQIAETVKKLAKEYKLDWELSSLAVKGFDGYRGVDSPRERIDTFIQNLEKLTPGLWIFVDHPALNTPEMQATYHKGYETVAQDRDAVTQVFTSPEVKQAIERSGIELVSYADVKKWIKQ
jgi:chitin disaccharide deacetylase